MTPIITPTDIRNIAIIAHVDHGKTTLVDAMLRQTGALPDYKEARLRIMDSDAQERERGITIFSKNTSVTRDQLRINVIDTPGHADFSGEVERILKMVDGVLLIVDAYEGPMPQTRFVLGKALDFNLRPIVVINKMDRPDARPNLVYDRMLDLFIELGADEEQLDFPVVCCRAREGIAWLGDPADLAHEPRDGADDLSALFDVIRDKVPPPADRRDEPFKMLVSNIAYDDYIGRVAIGRVERGVILDGAEVSVSRGDQPPRSEAISGLFRFDGLHRVAVDRAMCGDIVCVAGPDPISIGDTISDPADPSPLTFVEMEEPSIAMVFAVNDSPFAGREGRFVTSRHLRERLYRETERNIALIVEDTERPEAFVVKGRGELHLSVFIETMRREGYEFKVGKPRVVTKMRDGVLTEPLEELVIDVPEAFTGTVIESLGRRKAELITLSAPEDERVRMIFQIPTRGLIGYRSRFLTETRGHGIMASNLIGMIPGKGEIPTRGHGVLVAFESGEAVPYGLYHAQDRGELFIGPGTPVYEGMIVGRTAQPLDVAVNVCKRKHVTNMRAAGSDEALRLVTPVSLSLEQCIEFIEDDEWMEVTPETIRLRKDILNTSLRQKARGKA